jgi:hypothetical protein
MLEYALLILLVYLRQARNREGLVAPMGGDPAAVGCQTHGCSGNTLEAETEEAATSSRETFEIKHHFFSFAHHYHSSPLGCQGLLGQ